MHGWPMRVLGALNVVFVALGAFYAAAMIQRHWHNWPGSPIYQDWVIFVALNAISIAMILYLGFLGIKLMRVDANALFQLCLLFVAEIAYFGAIVYVTWFVVPDSMSTVAVSFWGMAQNPLVPQIVTGFPLVGLIICLVMLLIRRSPKSARNY